MRLLRLRSTGVEVRFALYAAVALLLAAVAILVSVRRDTMRRAENGAVAQSRLVARAVVPQVLGPTDFRAPISGHHLLWLDTTFKSEVLSGGAVRVKLYSPSGLVTYSTNHNQIGQEADDPAEIAKVIGGTPVSDVSRLGAEGGGGTDQKVIESYVPVSFGGSKPVGVLEIYENYAPIASAVWSATWMIAVVLAGVLVLLYVTLLPVLRRLTRRLREQLATTERIATEDGLTGLPNRLVFQARAARAIENDDAAAVVLLDLDHFKEVNDTLGHEHGDRLIVDVADRLRSVIGPRDTIARLGGDEFAFVVPGAGMTAAHAFARRLLDALARPFGLDSLRLTVRASAGFSLFPQDGSDTETLLRKAEVAMYAGKEHHVPVAYTTERDHYSPDRLELLGQLEGAIEDEQLVVYFQPVVDVLTGAVRQYEALVRWQHPDRGLLAPATFISLAERTGMIGLLTASVLRSALRSCSEWRGAGSEAGVAVNVSGHDLADRRFAATVARLLAEADVPASMLELEISENAILTDPLRTGPVLHDLHELGVRLAIDDFGAGHTSLAYLGRLPVDTLKIDRSLLEQEVVVQSAIELAHRLGLVVVAEGVETARALARLEELGCDLAQGYLLGRPQPAPEPAFAATA